MWQGTTSVWIERESITRWTTGTNVYNGPCGYAESRYSRVHLRNWLALMRALERGARN
ncbi:protein of unknown function (plasmid) [Cupriavidus taiwanensis]|uniref:Uncharacterized protein n=1 Tax=Cupriavidus taiwanensis TaxID=164546 RepID=A0A375EES4_9BURK|nr:hypothetical protein CBM2613_U10114 [Cupriavidus taiwanensis]SPA11579.1 protein of unknown function [Cupriavidus taiwanensis]